MRVTADTRAATRLRIMEVSQRLFASQGFDAVTTRDIAREAEIAAGTLFNYFLSKEAIVASLIGEALESVNEHFEQKPPEPASFEEELFALVAAGLRKLRPLRRQIPAVLSTLLHPLVSTRDEGDQRVRASHLTAVARLGRKHGFQDLPASALNLYWSLYTGLFLFWANDKSPRQEDTLALLDSSMEMFVAWLERQPDSSLGKSKENRE